MIASPFENHSKLLEHANLKEMDMDSVEIGAGLEKCPQRNQSHNYSSLQESSLKKIYWEFFEEH